MLVMTPQLLLNMLEAGVAHLHQIALLVGARSPPCRRCLPVPARPLACLPPAACIMLLEAISRRRHIGPGIDAPPPAVPVAPGRWLTSATTPRTTTQLQRFWRTTTCLHARHRWVASAEAFWLRARVPIVSHVEQR